MRQTLHIFKKDVRHLWFEVAVAITVVAAFAFTGARRALWLLDPATNRIAAWTLVMILLPLAWWTLIARVIHDEVLPGDSQFWTTRPYSWKSLLGAKVLFILAFISLPMLLADGIIVRAYGLPIGAELPGLLWSQVLLAIVFVLPITALSAVTTGFVQLIFAILTPCVIALCVAIVAPEVVLGGFFGGSDWVKTYYVFLLMSVAASGILVWQYSMRRTAAARFLAVAAGILAVLGMTLIPWSAAFRIQSWFSKQRVDQSLVHVDFDSGNRWLTRAVIIEGGSRVRVELPLTITDLPAGMIARPEGFSVDLQALDGAMWQADQLPLTIASKMGQKFSLEATVDGAFYRRVKDEPLKVRGSLYMTLFGNRQTVRVPFGDRSVRVPRVGVCSASGGPNRPTYFLICSSAFRFPPVLVSYRFIESGKEAVQDVWSSTEPRRPISYSPFPAELGISPVSQDFTFSTVHVPLAEARVDTVEPIAHIRQNFEVDNLRLGDFEVRPAPASP
jgi:hypothetical protein